MDYYGLFCPSQTTCIHQPEQDRKSVGKDKIISINSIQNIEEKCDYFKQCVF